MLRGVREWCILSFRWRARPCLRLSARTCWPQVCSQHLNSMMILCMIPPVWYTSNKVTYSSIVGVIWLLQKVVLKLVVKMVDDVWWKLMTLYVAYVHLGGWVWFVPYRYVKGIAVMEVYVQLFLDGHFARRFLVWSMLCTSFSWLEFLSRSGYHNHLDKTEMWAKF